MGDTASFEVHPEIKHHDQIMNAFYMIAHENNKTQGYIHQQLQKQLMNTTQGKMDRRKNPFCPVVIQPQINWLTCCFISPMALIANPLYLLEEKGYFEKECTVRVMYDNTVTKLPIIQAIRVQKYNICILFLQKPYYNLGWAGIKFINSAQELKNKQLRIINHPRVTYDQEANTSIHEQVIKVHKANGEKILDSQFCMEYHEDIIGSLVFEVQNGKPYILGIQTAEHQTLFICKQKFNEIRSQAKHYCKSKFGGQTTVNKELSQGLYENDKMI